MSVVSLLFGKILLMFALILLGLFLSRKAVVTQAGSKELSGVLVKVIIPCAIFKSFITVQLSKTIALHVLVSFFFAVAALLLSMAISFAIFGKRHVIENFSSSFSNASFMGIPLVEAVLGNEAVIYVASFVALLNIFQWTYGLYIMTGKREFIHLKKIVTNPVLISFLLGIICFTAQVQIPNFLKNAVDSLAQVNTPLAMITIGILMEKVNLKTIWQDKSLWLCSIVRLVLIPLLTIPLIRLFPSQMNIVYMAVLIAASAPVGSNVALFAQLYDQDYGQATKAVCLSTFLCILSMPLILSVAEFLNRR